MLLQQIAEFIGRPSFLTDHPDVGRILLVEMEKERLRNDGEEAPVYSSLAKWRKPGQLSEPVRRRNEQSVTL